jgi:hypothetical protein
MFIFRKNSSTSQRKKSLLYPQRKSSLTDFSQKCIKSIFDNIMINTEGTFIIDFSFDSKMVVIVVPQKIKSLSIFNGLKIFFPHQLIVFMY